MISKHHSPPTACMLQPGLRTSVRSHLPAQILAQTLSGDSADVEVAVVVLGREKNGNLEFTNHLALWQTKGIFLHLWTPWLLSVRWSQGPRQALETAMTPQLQEYDTKRGS